MRGGFNLGCAAISGCFAAFFLAIGDPTGALINLFGVSVNLTFAAIIRANAQ